MGLTPSRVKFAEDLEHIYKSMVLMFADNALEITQQNWDLENTTNMTMNDTLAMALSTILNAEKVGKPTCIVHPISKTAKAVLEIMKAHQFIGEFTAVEDGKGGYIEITLCVLAGHLAVVE